MLDNLNGPSSEDIVKKIKALGDAEPVEPPEDPKAEQEEVEETESEAGEVEETESEENPDEDTESGDGNETESDEELYVDIDGEEVSLNTIKEWKSNGLKHSDYTRKTMSLAENRKTLEKETEGIKALSSSLTDKIASVDSIISEDENKIDWEELRDYDPSGYLKKKEEFAAKRGALKDAQAQQQEVIKLQVAEEAKKLIDSMPAWSDTKVRDQEVADAIQFATKLGFTDTDLNAITDHRIYMALVSAAKFDKLKEGKTRVKKKVSQAPKVLKPSQKSKTKAPKTNLQEAKSKLKRSGSEKDAHEALKALFG